MEARHDITLIGRTTFRNERKLFGIKQADRRHHMYIIGRTGTGKSTLIETMVRQDIEAGRGLALFDPHGDLVEHIAGTFPERRQGDLIYFDAPDRSLPFGFNPLANVPPEKRPLAAGGVLEAFKKLWADSWGPRLEHILRNALLALLEQPEPTLADVLRLLDESAFRRRAAERVVNARVRDFWLREYESYPVRLRAEAIAPVQNKVGAFLAHPILNGILTQPRTLVDLRRVMDGGKVLLVNLAKGKLGEDASSLLGALLVAGINTAALGRTDVGEEDRRDFFVYLDEFQSYTTLTLADMLPELRKYHVGLILAHQFLSQLEPKVRDAVLGNAGTILSFRIGPEDADILEQVLRPEFRAADLVGLPNRQMYLRLMIDGVVSRAFSAETVLPD